MSAIWDARKCGAIVIFKEKESYDVGLCTWTLLGLEIDLKLGCTPIYRRAALSACFVIGDTVAGHKMFIYSACTLDVTLDVTLLVSLLKLHHADFFVVIRHAGSP